MNSFEKCSDNIETKMLEGEEFGREREVDSLKKNKKKTKKRREREKRRPRQHGNESCESESTKTSCAVRVGFATKELQA